MDISEFQQKAWLERLRRDFNLRYAYGFEDQDDVFWSVVADVIVEKLPHVTLTDKVDPAGYVLGMFRKRVIDYFRHFHGRHRPPRALQSLPEPYPQIFYEFCLGGFKNEVIAKKLKLKIDEVVLWVTWLRENKRCPPTIKSVSLEDAGIPEGISDVPEYHPSNEFSSVEHNYASEYNKTIAQWILSNFSTDPLSIKNTDSRISNLIKWLEKLDKLPKPVFDSDDIFLLKMFYLQGLKTKEVAELLNIKTHQVDYKHNKILDTIEVYLRRHGIELND